MYVPSLMAMATAPAKSKYAKAIPANIKDADGGYLHIFKKPSTPSFSQGYLKFIGFPPKKRAANKAATHANPRLTSHDRSSGPSPQRDM